MKLCKLCEQYVNERVDLAIEEIYDYIYPAEKADKTDAIRAFEQSVQSIKRWLK